MKASARRLELICFVDALRELLDLPPLNMKRGGKKESHRRRAPFAEEMSHAFDVSRTPKRSSRRS